MSLLCTPHIIPHLGFPGGSGGEQCARETRIPSLGWEDSLEEEMATRSSVLAWDIPQTEQPGGATARGVTKSQTRLSDGAGTQLTSDWASVCRKANFLSSGSIQHIRKSGGHTEISAKNKKKTIQIFSPSVGKNPFLRRTYFPILDKSEGSAARPHSRRGRKWSSQPTSRPGIWEQSLEGWRLSWRSGCPPQGRREQAGT